MHKYAPKCTDMHRHAPIYTDMHRHAPICTDMYRYAPTCAPTTHAGITHLGTSEHYGHPQHTKELHVSARSGILSTYKTSRICMSGHIWTSWTFTKHDGITHPGTFGHPGHLQHMRDMYVWAHLGILGTHKTRRNYTSGHIWASWAFTQHEGCVRLCTSGHPGHPHKTSGITHLGTCGHPLCEICLGCASMGTALGTVNACT
jgi:hypothetical protein